MDRNLLRLFDFYLMLMLLLGVYRRRTVYRDALYLTFGFLLKKWPRLWLRFQQHRAVLINRATMKPVIFTLILMAVQMIATRVLFPDATVTLRELLEPWWHLAIVLAAFVPMVAVDLYFIIRVGTFDRVETIKSFQQAETWAGTWRTKMVRAATLGFVNPDRIVDAQVKDGLSQLSATLIWAMWWVSVQVVLRTLFGLALWTMWWV